MADSKISNLTSVSAIADTDLFAQVQNLSTTPVTRKLAWSLVKSTLKTYFDTVYPYKNGWTPDSDTWTYASSTSFTVTGDVRSRFPVGTKLMLTNGSLKYFYVTSTSYSTNTTVNVYAGSVYSLSAVAISGNYYSYQSNPQGFPTHFAFTPSVTSFTVVGTPTYNGKLAMVGKQVIITIGMTSTTSLAIVAGTSYITMPIDVAFTTVCSTAVYGQAVANGIVDAASDRAYPGAVTATGNEIGFHVIYFTA